MGGRNQVDWWVGGYATWSPHVYATNGGGGGGGGGGRGGVGQLASVMAVIAASLAW